MARKSTIPSGATTIPTEPDGPDFRHDRPAPGLVLAWEPQGILADDRAPIGREITIGRSSSSSWCIPDRMLSRSHFSVSPKTESTFSVKDLGSRNGVFLNGKQVETEAEATFGGIIRAGGCLFVLEADLKKLSPADLGRSESPIKGKFFAEVLVQELKIAAKTGLPVLIEGETGVGKELAAQTLHEHYEELGRAGSLLTHNAACFAGEDDAIANLFGVTKGAFTGVESRKGSLELAEKGTFFLDEMHALPLRVQRSLLRFVEEQLLQPLGQVKPIKRPTDVRLIFGTNVGIEQACEGHLLAHDLIARLYRVTVPSLRDRQADIPSIFVDILQKTMTPEEFDRASPMLSSKIMERLCLHDFKQGNVRELIKIVAVITARLHEGEETAFIKTLEQMLVPQQAEVSPSLDETSEDLSRRSLYEKNREEILQVYEEVGGNLSKMVDILRGRGLRCSRRWLAEYLSRWKVRPIPKRKF